jgi:hypothetical protein
MDVQAVTGRLALVGVAFLLAACADGSSSTPTNQGASGPVDGCAHVVDVEVTSDGVAYTFAVTVESADTGWEKYADAWEVRSADGEVLATRELAHPHVDEQPFTRSLSGVLVPDGMNEVTVAARDSVEGFCGETSIVALPG